MLYARILDGKNKRVEFNMFLKHGQIIYFKQLFFTFFLFITQVSQNRGKNIALAMAHSIQLPITTLFLEITISFNGFVNDKTSKISKT